MKNRRWNRDELILVLDLYFKLDSKKITSDNEQVIEMSNLLRLLAGVTHTSKISSFRNPNGVAMKLGNFLAIDPNYAKAGLSSYSKLDKEIFLKYFKNIQQLKTEANLISLTASRNMFEKETSQFENEVDLEVSEGGLILKLHKSRERDQRIIKAKKKKVLKEKGKLECEVCSFDFFKTYGEVGKNFIECHHIKPISQYKIGEITKIDDLAIVCSNCHRMLHRSGVDTSLEELKKCMEE